jgi:hypothetical protein
MIKQDQKNPQRFPRFKKKGQGVDPFRYPQGFKLDGDRVFLPKRGWVRFINSLEIEGTPGNVTVPRRGDHWPVSIQTERQAVEPRHPSASSVGIVRRQLEYTLAWHAVSRNTPIWVAPYISKGQDMPVSPVKCVVPSCRRQQESSKATALKPMPMGRCRCNPRSSGRGECQRH